MIAPRKNAPKTNFSCILISILGRDKKYTATAIKEMLPIRCVQILPVSVWIRNMDLKQALTDGSGGLWPFRRKSLSRSQCGRAWCGIAFQPESQTYLAKSSTCSAQFFGTYKRSSSAASFRSTVGAFSSSFSLGIADINLDFKKILMLMLIYKKKVLSFRDFKRESQIFKISWCFFFYFFVL